MRELKEGILQLFDLPFSVIEIDVPLMLSFEEKTTLATPFGGWRKHIRTLWLSALSRQYVSVAGESCEGAELLRQPLPVGAAGVRRSRRCHPSPVLVGPEVRGSGRVRAAPCVPLGHQVNLDAL